MTWHDQFCSILKSYIVHGPLFFLVVQWMKQERATPWKLKKYSGFSESTWEVRRIGLVTKSVSSRMSKSRWPITRGRIGVKISCCFEDDMSSKRYQYLTGTSFFILIHKGHFSYFLRTPQVRTKWHVILKWYIYTTCSLSDKTIHYMYSFIILYYIWNIFFT